MMNPFEEIKNRLSIKEVAGRYGIKILKNKKALCPFHQDSHPSLSFKNDKFFKCFVCESHGSAIDMVMHLFNLTPLEAARKIDKDFHLGLFNQNLTKKQRLEVKKKIQKEKECELVIEDFEGDIEKKEKWFVMVFRIFNQTIKDKEIAPQKNQDRYSIWELVIHNINRVENILDVLQRGSPDEKVESYEFIKDYQEKLNFKILKIIEEEQ